MYSPHLPYMFRHSWSIFNFQAHEKPSTPVNPRCMVAFKTVGLFGDSGDLSHPTSGRHKTLKRADLCLSPLDLKMFHQAWIWRIPGCKKSRWAWWKSGPKPDWLLGWKIPNWIDRVHFFVPSPPPPCRRLVHCALVELRSFRGAAPRYTWNFLLMSIVLQVKGFDLDSWLMDKLVSSWVRNHSKAKNAWTLMPFVRGHQNRTSYVCLFSLI